MLTTESLQYTKNRGFAPIAKSKLQNNEIRVQFDNMNTGWERLQGKFIAFDFNTLSEVLPLKS